LQAQDEAAGMADDAGGEVEEPVAQRLGFGVGQWAGKQQRLGKAGEVLGGKDELEPDGVAAPPVEGEVGQAGGLGGADAVLDPGPLAVPQLQPGKVRVGLVGDKALEAVAVVVGEAQLGAGMGILPAADPPGAGRPGVQVDPAGQLAHLGAVADLAVGLHRGRPGRLGLGQDRLADMGVDRHAKPEPDPLVGQVPGQPGAGSGAVASHQHGLVGGRQLRQGEVHQLRDGPASASQLANGERVTAQAIGTAIGALHQRGLVERTPDPGDGRKTIVSLTDPGRSAFTVREQTVIDRMVQAVESGYTPAERRQLAAAAPLLERLADLL
jgi:DNA-binding MarR family transcriptional regulator